MVFRVFRVFRVFIAAVAMVFSTEIGAAAEILVSRTQQGIVVRGNLEAGDEQKFIQLALPLEQALVIFDSEGGNAHAGIEIGRFIRRREFSTFVARDSWCVSACAIAWLGGTTRYLMSGSRIGFHAAHRIENGVVIESGVGNALVGAYLNEIELSARAIAYITSPTPFEMQLLDAADAREYGIETTMIAEIDAVTRDFLTPLNQEFDHPQPSISDGTKQIYDRIPGEN